MVRDYVRGLDVRMTTKAWLNFARLDLAPAVWDTIMEGLLFLANPDMLAGLAVWAWFDNNEPDAVVSIFGSGCASVVNNAVRANRENSRSVFLGLFDISVRPWIGGNELGFIIPRVRFEEMRHTLRQSCVTGTSAWQKLRERMAANPL